MNLKRGRYLLRMGWLRIYINGSFSRVEFNLGKIGGWEVVTHLFTIYQQSIRVSFNPSLKYLENKINRKEVIA